MIDKVVSTNGIKKFLNNPRQLEKLIIELNKELNFILNCAQKVIDFVQEIKNKNQINEDLHNKVRPVGSQPGGLYSVVKVQKKFIDVYPAFRLILSVIGIPTYAITNVFVPMLKDLTSNEYSVKDSFDFAKEILQQNSI